MGKIAIMPSERWLIQWFSAIPYENKLRLWRFLNALDE